MKDFFYGLIIVIFCVIVYDTYKNPLQYDISDFNNAIVIDKESDYFMGDIMYLKYSNDSIVRIRCYDIIFEKYNVGDTIPN